MKKQLLQANALYLGIASVGAFFLLDLGGLVLDSGPVAQIVGAAPHAAVGFVEAHGLALILSVVFWRVPAERFWHLVAAATMGLLGVCNLVFWPIFTATGMVLQGALLTALHLAFAAAQITAAIGPRARAAVELS